VSTIPPILIWLVLGLLVYSLVTSVTAVLAARAHFETARHDLIVKSKLLRHEYLNSLGEQDSAPIDDSVVFEDEDAQPEQAA